MTFRRGRKVLVSRLGSLILIVGGLYALLAAYGVFPLSKDIEANNEWVRNFGTLIKIASPLIILYGARPTFWTSPIVPRTTD